MKGGMAMKLKFELCNYDPITLDWDCDETDVMVEHDTDLFNDCIETIKDKIENKLDEIDEYRYELDDLTEDEFDDIQGLLDDLDEEFQICFIEIEEF